MKKLLKVFRKSKIPFPLKDLSVHLYVLELEKGLKNVQNLMFLFKVVTRRQGDAMGTFLEKVYKSFVDIYVLISFQNNMLENS